MLSKSFSHIHPMLVVNDLSQDLAKESSEVPSTTSVFRLKTFTISFIDSNFIRIIYRSQLMSTIDCWHYVVG